MDIKTALEKHHQNQSKVYTEPQNQQDVSLAP